MKTIKSNKEIDYIFKNGKKISLPFLNFFILKDKQNYINGQVAFIAGKKYGNSVWRNKSKRRLREVYNKLSILPADKLLLVAKKDINNYKFDYIVGESQKKYDSYKENM